MRVMRIEVHQFRGIECQEVQANGKHIRVRGGNGQGKTSFALSFLYGLTGKGTAQPVRNGADEAEIKIDVGDFVFTRKAFADGRPTSFVGRPKGSKAMPATPAAFVRQLIGTGIALDPLAIFSMRDEDQVATILRAFRVDVTKEDAEADRVYKERTATNDRRKAADARIKDLETRGAKQDAPARTDPAEVRKRMAEAEADLVERSRRADVLAKAAVRASIAKEALARAIAEDEAAAIAQAEAAEAVGDVGAVEKAKHLLAIVREEFGSINDRNAAADMGAELRQKLAESEELRRASEKLTEALDGIAVARASKIDAAAKAAGIDGLQFSPDKKGANLNGVRLSELNEVAKLKLGVKIGLAENPELRTAIVDRASEFDDQRTKELLEWGDAEQVQLVLASVAKDGAALEIEVFDAEGAAT